MKYSIRGTLKTADGTPIVTAINKYTLWKFEPSYNATDLTGLSVFNFEVWLNTLADKDGLFNDLKPYTDQYTGFINWHECTHDQISPQPCVIAEEYVR